MTGSSNLKVIVPCKVGPKSNLEKIMDNQLFDRMTTGSFYRRLFAFCRSIGVSRVNVEYSGGGDSGGVDNIEVTLGQGSWTAEQKKNITRFFRENLGEELGNPIYDRHGSFADGGGYSVNGSVIYNAENNTAWIEGTDHYYEFTESEDGEDGEDTCNEEPWDEMLYDVESAADEDDQIEDDEERTYDFVVVYAKLKNEQLPEVYHNHLAAAAIAGDDKAKEYMAWLGKR